MAIRTRWCITIGRSGWPRRRRRAVRPAGRTGAARRPPASPIQLQLRWTPAEVAEVARDCNGCGACRSQLSDVRMCPIFRLAPAEESSPRAKANVMRAVLAGKLDPATLASDEFKAVADLCVNCKMCRLECPASIDIPRLMIEGKGAYVRVNGLSTSDWIMSRIDWLSAVGQHAAGRSPIGPSPIGQPAG